MVGEPIRILSIDGGGIRGILPARLLQEIEKQTGKKTCDLFDLISGTSTGGILGCGLFKGISPKDLGDLYAQRGGEIFAHSLWRSVKTVGGIEGPRYDPATLEKILSDTLGNAMLSDAPARADLLVPTYVIELPTPVVIDGVPTTRTPMLFKTWKARGVDLAPGETAPMFDFALKDVARATSAAPTYFAPARYQNRAGDTYASVDGGVFANNPAICALVAAYKRYGKDKRYILVSLGTGSLERAIPYADAKGWGDLQWLHPVLSILMDGNADTVSYEADQVLGDDHFRFEISTGLDPNDPATVNEDFDCADPDNIARLERLAQRLIANNAARIKQLVTLL
ncbi:MAG: patatin-like phospholipase family protein [Alphaproteobacteria bacterium]